MTEQDKRNEEFYQELMQDDLYARYASNYLPHWADARLNGVPEQYAQYWKPVMDARWVMGL